MPNQGDRYVVQVKPSHIKWGEYRNPTNRAVIQGESYVKIPAGPARDFGLVRGTHYTPHFTDGRAPPSHQGRRKRACTGRSPVCQAI